ncbi:hypothetical protein EDD11_000072 [Mortierella claussenii]|nr:hypothetical protein EDD11_000072 [Mortierella claussenii]
MSSATVLLSPLASQSSVLVHRDIGPPPPVAIKVLSIPELLEYIVQYLRPYDLMNLRVVCRLLNAVVSPGLPLVHIRSLKYPILGWYIDYLNPAIKMVSLGLGERVGSVHLDYLTPGIMLNIQQHCPNIRHVSVMVHKDWAADRVDYMPFLNALSTLQHLELEFTTCPTEETLFAFLDAVSSTARLEHLTSLALKLSSKHAALQNMFLDWDLIVEILDRVPMLHSLTILNFTVHTYSFTTAFPPNMGYLHRSTYHQHLYHQKMSRPGASELSQFNLERSFPRITSLHWQCRVCLSNLLFLNNRFPSIRSIAGFNWSRCSPRLAEYANSHELSTLIHSNMGWQCVFTNLTRLSVHAMKPKTGNFRVLLRLCPRLQDLELTGLSAGKSYSQLCMLEHFKEQSLQYQQRNSITRRTMRKDGKSSGGRGPTPTLIKRLVMKAVMKAMMLHHGWYQKHVEKLLRLESMSQMEELDLEILSVEQFVVFLAQDAPRAVDTRDVVHQWRMMQDARNNIKPPWFQFGATLRVLKLSTVQIPRLLNNDTLKALNRILREELPALVELSVRNVVESLALFNGMGDEEAAATSAIAEKEHRDWTSIKRPYLEKIEIQLSGRATWGALDVERQVAQRFWHSLTHLDVHMPDSSKSEVPTIPTASANTAQNRTMSTLSERIAEKWPRYVVGIVSAWSLIQDMMGFYIAFFVMNNRFLSYEDEVARKMLITALVISTVVYTISLYAAVKKSLTATKISFYIWVFQIVCTVISLAILLFLVATQGPVDSNIPFGGPQIARLILGLTLQFVIGWALFVYLRDLRGQARNAWGRLVQSAGHGDIEGAGPIRI